MSDQQIKNEYMLDVGDADLKRMTMLGNIYKDYNTQFILRNGLTKDLQVADVGCGPGNVSLWLAQVVGERGSVTSIDNNDEQLALLKAQALKQGISQIKPHKADVYELSTHFDQQFDIVFCRFLLIHLTEPLKAIDQLKRILKPGGRLIICELENHTWSTFPENEDFKKEITLQSQIIKLRGIDLDIGKQLYAYFRQSGLTSLDVEIAQPVLTKENREYLIFKTKLWGKIYKEYNLISDSELIVQLENIKQVVLNEDYLLLGARMFHVAGTK